MSLEFIVVGQNGQLEIDFNSLELVTSKEVVETIKERIESHSNKNISLSLERNNDPEDLVKYRVYLSVGRALYCITVWQFPHIEKEEINVHFMTYGAAKRLIEMSDDSYSVGENNA